MSKLIKKAIAIVLAIWSLFIVVDTAVTAIKVFEAMRISGEISTALACTIGGLSGVSVVLVCGAILAILIIAINKINNNTNVSKNKDVIKHIYEILAILFMVVAISLGVMFGTIVMDMFLLSMNYPITSELLFSIIMIVSLLLYIKIKKVK